MAKAKPHLALNLVKKTKAKTKQNQKTPDSLYKHTLLRGFQLYFLEDEVILRQ